MTPEQIGALDVLDEAIREMRAANRSSEANKEQLGMLLPHLSAAFVERAVALNAKAADDLARRYLATAINAAAEAFAPQDATAEEEA